MTDLFEFAGPMKALSLWQPWASLIAAGVKRHETRHWSTAYRGPIAIHAAKTIDVAGAPDELCIAALGQHWARTVPIGMVVAVGRLTHCRITGHTHSQSLTQGDRVAGNFTPGRYAWTIERVRPLRQPIPALGRQGLFNWSPPEGFADQLGCVLDHGEACRFIGWA